MRSIDLFKSIVFIGPIGPTKFIDLIDFSEAYTVYSVRWATYFPVNRVEHQKLNQTAP